MIKLIPCLLLLLSCQISSATHLRGGYISVRHISGLTYAINVELWTDTGSSVESDPGNLYLNGRKLADDIEVTSESSGFIPAGPEISFSTYGVLHTFPAPGTYELAYYDYNRDAGILNIPNSVDTPFTVKTTMTIDPIYGNNSTPRPAPFAWGGASLGTDYFHLLGFNDQEGDSLSFHRAVPLSSDSTLVKGHQFLGEFGDSFFVHPVSGELQWLQPQVSGKFTFAIMVREWRKIGDGYVLISESVFDGMINAYDLGNNTMAIVDVENSNCLDFGQTHRINIALPEGPARAYFSSDYEGTIFIDGEILPPTGISLDLQEDVSLDIEFVDDHPSSGTVNFLRLVIQDTSNFNIGSRALHFSNDCTSIVTNIPEVDVQPIHFYPNPAKNVVQVDLSGLLGQVVEIQMYNSVGQEVYWDRLIADDKAMKFAVASLPRGIYLIKVAYDKKQHTERIVLD